MSPITTHVLDTATGKPAEGIEATLEKQENGQWQLVGKGRTDADGRIKTLLKEGSLTAGFYRLTFDAEAYFKGLKTQSFYKQIPVQFQIEGVAQHYHVPLLLSPFGYSTYRGS
jgi:5-hydroxyisourate hydrolase